MTTIHWSHHLQSDPIPVCALCMNMITCASFVYWVISLDYCGSVSVKVITKNMEKLRSSSSDLLSKITFIFAIEQNNLQWCSTSNWHGSDYDSFSVLFDTTWSFSNDRLNHKKTQFYIIRDSFDLWVHKKSLKYNKMTTLMRYLPGQ